MERVLIACPTYEGMAYCFKEFIEKLRDLDYENHKIAIFDNTRTKGFFRKIRKIFPDIKVIYDNTKEKENMKRLISSRNKILDYAIEKDFDYILMLDNDVMVPRHLLKTLISFNKDVVSGLYYCPFRRGGKMVLLPVAYGSISQEEFDMLKEKGKLPKYAEKIEHVMRHLNKKELQQPLVEVFAPSGGCLLLSRKAFTSGARYGREDFPKEINPTDDIYFFNRLREKGFKLYCCPKLLCKHVIGGKYALNEGVHPLTKSQN